MMPVHGLLRQLASTRVLIRGIRTRAAGESARIEALRIPRPYDSLPIVAIIGAPNAGKSTLFNRIVGDSGGMRSFKPRALVSPMAGTTRDRLESPAEWKGVQFRLVDTGGVYNLDEVLLAAAKEKNSGEIERLVEAQVLAAVENAHIVLFVVDANADVTATDERLAPHIRRLRTQSMQAGGAPHVMLTVNKV